MYGLNRICDKESIFNYQGSNLTAGGVFDEVVRLTNTQSSTALGVTIKTRVVSEARSSQHATRHCTPTALIIHYNYW